MNNAAIRNSERIYNFLLKFYPKPYQQEFGEEMKFVFIESLKDSYRKHGNQGIITVWIRTIIDAGKSLFAQHLENKRGGVTLKTKRIDILMQNKIFFWIALGTGLLLLIPFFAMQYNWGGVNWSLSDFVVMGMLLFGFSSIFVFAARKNKKHRLLIGTVVALAFLWLWAELAVGVFTNWGS